MERTLFIVGMGMTRFDERVHNRYDKAVEQRGGQESEEDDLCHGALYLVAGQVAAECQWDKRQCSGEGGHQDWVQSVCRTLYNTLM